MQKLKHTNPRVKEKHYDLSDIEFEKDFITCSIVPSHFSHEAHLRLAWIHIEKYGIKQAQKNIQIQLGKYVEFAGAKDKFNMTLTVAATKTINCFKQRSKSNNFQDFIIEFPKLKNNFKDLMASHYSFDIYNSEKAKKEFLEPDLLPFD